MNKHASPFDDLINAWVAEGKMRQGGTEWPKEKWAAEFPAHQKLFYSAPTLLDRKSVGNIARSSLQSKKYLDAFLISMAWGYGTRGYGRYRTQKVLENENFDELIAESGNLAFNGQPVEAIAIFEKYKPKGIKIAYASKYLYFASYGSKREALILDSFLEEFLRENEMLNLKLLKFDARNYETYLDFMEDKAKQFGVKPGVLEEAFFYQLNPEWA